MLSTPSRSPESTATASAVAWSLASVCDYVVASTRARFGQPEIKLGCFPPVAAALLPRRIGVGRTLELVLSGRLIDAAEAVALGLAHEALPSAELDARVAALADLVRSQSAAATRIAKRAVRSGEDRPFEPALAEAERLYLRDLAASADMAEGIAAFAEKRPPVWSHR